MLAYYGAQISPHMIDTPEGYLICRDVPIARTGEMAYLASELGLEGERLVTVNRRPEDVFDPDALASFEGKDVTAGHPAGQVGPVNYAAYSKGHVQNVRREGDFVLADLLIAAAVGGFEAEADSASAVLLTGCRWAGPADASKVAELRILAMQNA